MDSLVDDEISAAFKHKNLKVISNSGDLVAYLSSMKFYNLALLLMSSGKFEGIDFEFIKERIK